VSQLESKVSELSAITAKLQTTGIAGGASAAVAVPPPVDPIALFTQVTLLHVKKWHGQHVCKFTLKFTGIDV
jgi:hypothetical protein